MVTVITANKWRLLHALFYIIRLGIEITNNHTYRVELIAKLIKEDIDELERCLILGHSMQTKERHYS